MSKKSLLEEALKRHQQIVEYTFYTEENDDPDFPQGNEDDLLLGEQEPPAEEEPAEDIPPLEAPEVEDPMGDIGGEELPEPEMDMGDDLAGGMEIEDEFVEPTADIGGEEGEVEVDVTDIVTKTEEAKSASEEVGNKIDGLLSQFEELSSKLGDMDQIVNKIDNLEQEIEKRNPTPIEKLEMRSLDSFPYTVKLSDFWSDKEGYDTEPQEQEYTLTQQDIDDDYNESDVRSSFNMGDID